MIDPAQIEWGPITHGGEAMLAAIAAQQYNDIADRFGAERVKVPPSPLDSKPRPASRYKLQSAGELMQTEPIRWRIKGVIPEQGIGAIYGPSGSAKTFLALDMAMHLAGGAMWFGYRIRRCPVVYVCLEGEAGLSVRLKAYCERKGSIPEGVDFINQAVNLLDNKDVRDLVLAVQARYAGGGIVVIDTLNRAAPGMDENSSAEMGRVIAAAKVVQHAVGGLVLFVHHTGKDASKGLRGHSSLHAALDAAIEVSRTGDVREWSLAKAKDGQDGLSHPFKLEVVTMGLDNDGDLITSCVVQPAQGAPGVRSKPLTPTQQIGMDSFMTAAAANINDGDRQVHTHLDQWREEFYRRSTGDNPDSKRRAFSRVRKELVELGRLFVAEDVYRIPMGFGTSGTFAGHVPACPGTGRDTTL
jgi:hypothetical protein